MALNSALSQQLAALQAQIDELKGQRVTYVLATVASVSGTTFAANIPNPVDGSQITVSGIAAPSQFVPTVGATVTLALSGPHIVYLPNGLAPGAVTTTNLADGSVSTAKIIPGSVALTTLGSDVSGQITTANTNASQALTNAATAQSTATTASVNASTALTTANGKNKVTWATTAPTGSGTTTGDIWFQFASGVVAGAWQWNGSAWVAQTFGDSVLNTLTAAKITTGTLSSGVVVSAGPTDGDHSALDAQGFHVFMLDPQGQVTEVGRMGTGSNDFIGVGNSSGKLVAAIDQNGVANVTGLVCADDPVFYGSNLSALLTNIPGGGGDGTSHPGARNYVGWDGSAQINGFTSEVGLEEMEVYVETGRIYWIVPSLFWQASQASFLAVTVRDGGTGTPSLTSPIIDQCFYDTASTPANFQLAERHRATRFTTTGYHRLLLTVAMGGGGSGNVVTTGGGLAPMLMVVDLGPDFGNPATMNRGGGGTPVPLQQYYSNPSPSGHWSYRGNGTLRTDTTDVVQGYDPSGFNGDGKGGWNFTIPNISGSVDRVDLYIYNNWSYNNGGGQALISLVTNSNTAGPTTLQAAYNPGVTYPKPGPVTVTLPSSWYASFKSKTSIGLYLGPSGGQNETFYIRADGPSAQLRIWYTQ